jgi:plastocyanin
MKVRIPKYTFIIIGVLIAILGVVILSRDNDQSANTNHGSPITSVPLSRASVDINTDSFMPSTLTVNKGTQIIWTNRDTKAQSIKISSAVQKSQVLAQSQPISPGQTYTYSANTPGSIKYQETGSSLSGEIIVKE